MTPPSPDRIERLLAMKPALRPAPATLRPRVIEVISGSPARRRVGPFRPAFNVLAAAAAVALGAFVALRTPAPPIAKPPVAAGQPVSFPIDPTPAIVPVTRFFAGSLDAPVQDQIDGLLDETRKARDVVVSCLPFSRMGG